MAEQQAAKKILIVDDDRASRVLTRIVLQALQPPCAVTEAIGGEQALRMIQADPPDLILLDILMPDLDGVSICSAIKKDFATRGIKIVMVTARRDERMVRTGLLAGADDYLTKPFTRDQLLSTVSRMLK